MNHDAVWRAIDVERAGLADLFDDLSDDEWAAPSLCAGWRTRDVAAHLTLAHTAAPAAALDLLRARGGMNRMIHDTAIRRAQLPVRRYGELLRSMVGSRKKAPGVTALEPLIDVLVHGQDMAIPLRRDRVMSVGPAAAAATRVWAMGWPFRARRRWAGVAFRATDIDWSAGQGRSIEAPIADILLLLTGRHPVGQAEAARHLDGAPGDPR
jgi:uncharacterized protein (TIGR03083 family)